MPKLTIDDRAVEVPEGTKVIEAAERVGIEIPRFCYHPALGSIGACRVCAVKFLQGPFKGVQMSCMVDATDDMVVSTTDPEAVDFRRHVIEWLMINHPHDCPVCDEGGHCLLQDMTVSGGHGLRRYQGNKRTYRDQDLGPLIQHEMNRCIQCYRCSRYYQEYAGYRDLGTMGIASRVYYGRFSPGALESPFSGNLIDICPTGVYTDRPSRYKGRKWDYQRTPSVCIHCSLGCRTTVDVRYREVVRIEARYSPTVNGHFICDRGRYGFFYASAETRPRRARIGGAETGFEDALAESAHRIGKIVAHHGPEAVAVAGGSRSTLETLAAESRICTALGWRGPVLFADEAERGSVRRAAATLSPELAVHLEAVKRADLVFVVGVDPVNEAPMLAVALRQAWRKGAHVEVYDPRPVALPLEFTHRPLDAADICDRLGRLAESGGRREAEKTIAEKMEQCRRPVIVCGATGITGERVVLQAGRLARKLAGQGKRAGFFPVMTGANSFAAGRLAGDPGDLDSLLTRIESRHVRALVVVENDPLSRFPDLGRAADALARLDLLLVIDCIDSETAKASQVFFPSRTFFETGGTFANNEARIQQAEAAFAGGSPIAQTGGGSHPPRVFRSDIPGSAPLSARRILRDLASALGGEGFEPEADDPGKDLADTAPEFSGFDPTEAQTERGAWASLPVDMPKEADVGPPDETAPESGGLILVEAVFGTEPLSLLSPCLETLEAEPVLTLHPDDAGRLGLENGALCELSTGAGILTVPVRTSSDTAVGTLVLPRHRRLDWRIFPRHRTALGAVEIRKSGREAS